jgi:predicted N-acetyltransferase YhbS
VIVEEVLSEVSVAITIRSYDHHRDFDRVGRFLIDVYRPGPVLHNWLQPRWEYMFSHSLVDQIDLAAIGVAEHGGRIVGVTHPEHRLAFGYFQIAPDRSEVRPLLLDWAESRFGGWSRSLEADVLGLWIDEHDRELATLASARGFTIEPRFTEPHAQRSLTTRLPDAPVPPGYRLQSLEDDNDFAKIHRVLWRGFDHDGAPPQEGVADRVRAQATPGFRRDLTIVAVAPDDEYASFAGMWVVPQNRVAYVEPVATDPDHRRLGLGRAAVVEALRRARNAGAIAAYVGSDQPFYASIGFEVTCQTNLYVRHFRGRADI